MTRNGKIAGFDVRETTRTINQRQDPTKATTWTLTNDKGERHTVEEAHGVLMVDGTVLPGLLEAAKHGFGRMRGTEIAEILGWWPRTIRALYHLDSILDAREERDRRKEEKRILAACIAEHGLEAGRRAAWDQINQMREFESDSLHYYK